MLGHRLMPVSNRAPYVTFCQLRYASNKKKKIPETGHSARNITHDWIGPPDKESNIRPFKLYVPENESDVERQYREKREETQRWNQAFWADHNTRFYKLKENYVNKTLEEKKAKAKENGTEAENILTAEEMSVFYKKFLNDNYKTHFNYNREWYKKNIHLLWLALKTNTLLLFRKRK